MAGELKPEKSLSAMGLSDGEKRKALAPKLREIVERGLAAERRAGELADQCGELAEEIRVMRAELVEVLAENARLRRKLERLKK